MLKVGLTGGIGAGKSAVATRLAALGAVIVDSDRLAREVVAAGTDGQAEVVAAFGPEVLGPDGELDRPALGARVFGDEEARRRLEKIIHPRVRERAAALTAQAPPDAIVVNDVPLLVETGLAASYHLVVVVTADQGTRVRRLAETRGMTAEQAQARIAAQDPDEVRAAAADVLIANDGGLDDLDDAIAGLWHGRLRPYEENVRKGRTAPPDLHLGVSPYDPSWPAQADRLIARIRHVLGAESQVSHIGSTAVPGLAAKDLIDLMLGVRTLAEADALAPRLAKAGLPRRAGEWFDNARDMPGKTWPKRLHGSADPGREVHLHIRVIGSPGWRFALLMRDHLRSDEPTRNAYAEAKLRWRAEHPDLGSYSEAKEPWFDQEAESAEQWAFDSAWRPGI